MFTCESHRPIRAESMIEAATQFAARKARAAFGRKGYVRLCNLESWASDGSLAEYNAFIGYRSAPGETTGHNVRFTVYQRD